jgi:hypothetical protein
MMKKEGLETNNYEVVKRKIFTEAISMIFSAKYDSDDDPIVSSFPDDFKMSDERTWLPMHFAISLNVENKMCEEDVHILHAANPLAMHLFSDRDEEEGMMGYTPIQLLSMQKMPNTLLVRDLCSKGYCLV